ncbi:hypothetical protein EDB85DRAFT_2076743 [Lactarius pseudohatsudake]|nr:hypothetical protein EDB85DRAFT_2076743 [Lactarius pseudohatsudake]
MDFDNEDHQVGSQNEYDTATDLGFGNSKPDHRDKEGNPIITVVDRSGIHEISVSWCCCPEAPEREMQLMMAGLFPATFRNPKTVFTFRVLEDFHLDNLECKTTASQFFSRLRRLTNDEFPNTVPDRYRELLRVCRQWRDEEQKPGSMAIFCALCAQPGINLPEDWREYENRSTCHDHHTVNNVNKHSGHLESTGIGATACIHGAFVPDAVVDFQKGEA